MTNSKKRCTLKTCREYQPALSMLITPVGAFCTQEHALEYARHKQHKAREAQRKENAKARKERVRQDKQRKAKLKTLSEWVSEAQEWTNKVVVLADRPFGCISCKDGEVTDSGHYFHRGSKYRIARLTLDRRNLTGQCRACNSFKGGGNQHEYRLGYIARYGQQQFDDLCELKRLTDCGEIPALTIEDCKAVIVQKRAEFKALKARNW